MKFNLAQQSSNTKKRKYNAGINCSLSKETKIIANTFALSLSPVAEEQLQLSHNSDYMLNSIFTKVCTMRDSLLCNDSNY